ncbi:helix-turn-helix transcriptional regulator [Lactiplantibacillus plantarum]|uniref:helix-turn-helix transcriptional regulator n=1 Tax=Lactiplantibacillus plantarum TaxID=1590 RepID=UPI0009769919|nr:YafY family protein [Lactiplantibacillus plantarum]
MEKIDRILKIWLYISEKSNFTARELAHQFNVSTRTITRDLDYLSVIGVPFYSIKGNGGGYRMGEKSILPPVLFSKDELLSLFFALNILKKIPDIPFDASFWEIENKLKQQTTISMKNKANSIDKVITYVNPPKNRNNFFLKDCLSASLNKNIIEITYQKTSGNKKVRCHPIGIYSLNGFWYMTAFNQSLQEYRIFRVDRILNFDVIRKATSSENKLFTIEEWINTLKTKQTIDIKIIVDKDAYRSITNHWIINGNNEEYNHNSLLVTFSVAIVQLFYIRQDILKLGSKVKVISPVSLATDIKKEINLMLKIYE